MSSRPQGFEERLKAALLARLPEESPAPARGSARRYGIPLAVGLATAVVVAVMALPGITHNGSQPATGSTEAPEIKKDPDGSLRFELPQPPQVPALVERLKAMGVSAAVVPMRPPSQCSDFGGGYRGPQDDPEAEIMAPGGDGPTLKVNAKTVPPGYTLAFQWAEYYPLGAKGQSFGVIETAKLPPCAVDQSEGLEELLKSGAKDPGLTIEVPMPTVDELPELVRRLQAQGVSVAVTEKKPRSECSHVGGGYRGPQADPEAELTGPRRDSSTLKINSKTVPSGYTLVFTKPLRPSGDPVGAGVQETSKVTPCQIDFSPSDEERDKMRAEMQAKLKELADRQGAGTPSP